MGKIYAVRMREYNKGAGCLLRNWIAAKWDLQFSAGDATPKRPFRPSPVVEVTKEQYDYIMGRKVDGNPNVGQPRNEGIPVFQGWISDSRRELSDLVQAEADNRAAGGRTSARALLSLHAPVEAEAPIQPVPTVPVVNEPQKKEKPFPVASDVDKAGIQPIDVDEELGKTPEDQEPDEDDDEEELFADDSEPGNETEPEDDEEDTDLDETTDLSDDRKQEEVLKEEVALEKEKPPAKQKKKKKKKPARKKGGTSRKKATKKK